MSKLFKVAITADLPPGRAMAFEIEGERIAVFNINGTYYAIDDVCTHAGASLIEGCVEGCVVRCPRHRGGVRSAQRRFSLATGGPAGEGVSSVRRRR